jgi:hypothetical protein
VRSSDRNATRVRQYNAWQSSATTHFNLINSPKFRNKDPMRQALAC